ncbi:MAG: sulfite exporter TauE/SafE family protein [Roseobacter sp.]
MTDPVLLAQMLALLLAIGLFAGVLAGLLGVGGGIVLVPAFYYAFGTLGFGGEALMQLAVATSLATIVVTSLRSLRSHHQQNAVDWHILRTWAPGIALGAASGVLVVSQLDAHVLQFIFGGLALLIGVFMTAGRMGWRVAQDMPTGATRVAASGGVGVLSVLMGVGGGSFGVPIMTLHNVSIHKAVGTAAGFGLLIAVPSVAGFMLLILPAEVRPPLTVGSVNLVAFAIVISMTLISAPWGARLAHALHPTPLRRIFGVFLMLVAVNMILEAWRV